MKKKIFSLVAIAAISLSAWNYSENQNNVEFSDLALANVEALANRESVPDICKGCSTSNTTEYCCTIIINGGSFKIYRYS